MFVGKLKCSQMEATILADPDPNLYVSPNQPPPSSVTLN